MEQKTKRNLDWWCNRAWIKFGCLVSVVMLALILFNWNEWPTGIKIIAFNAVLIPIHVIEEWVFPGGFHYQYNVGLAKSDAPNAYPLNRLADMYTNLLATFMFAGLTFLCLYTTKYYNGVMLMTIIFCTLELIAHTLMGTIMYLRLKNRGKKNIYGPGSITTYWVFVPLGIIGLYQLDFSTISGFDLMVAAILLIILLAFIFGPTFLFQKKDTEYAFPDEKYFQRFL